MAVFSKWYCKKCKDHHFQGCPKERVTIGSWESDHSITLNDLKAYVESTRGSSAVKEPPLTLEGFIEYMEKP